MPALTELLSYLAPFKVLGLVLSQRGLSCYHRRASRSWALIGRAERRFQLSLPICQRGDADDHRRGRFHRSNTGETEMWVRTDPNPDAADGPVSCGR